VDSRPQFGEGTLEMAKWINSVCFQSEVEIRKNQDRQNVKKNTALESLNVRKNQTDSRQQVNKRVSNGGCYGQRHSEEGKVGGGE